MPFLVLISAGRVKQDTQGQTYPVVQSNNVTRWHFRAATRMRRSPATGHCTLNGPEQDLSDAIQDVMNPYWLLLLRIGIDG